MIYQTNRNSKNLRWQHFFVGKFFLAGEIDIENAKETIIQQTWIKGFYIALRISVQHNTFNQKKTH